MSHQEEEELTLRSVFLCVVQFFGGHLHLQDVKSAHEKPPRRRVFDDIWCENTIIKFLPATDMSNRVLHVEPHNRYHKHTITSHRTNTISTHGPLAKTMSVCFLN